MPNIEDLIEERTHKSAYSDVCERTFRTLNHIESLEPIRTSKLLSALMKNLHEKGILSDKDIDLLLLEASA